MKIAQAIQSYQESHRINSKKYVEELSVQKVGWLKAIVCLKICFEYHKKIRHLKV